MTHKITKFTARAIQKKASFVSALLIATIWTTGCASNKLTAAGSAEKAEIAQLSITDPRRSKDLNKAWRKVTKVTRVRKISDNRYAIIAKGASLPHERHTEINFFSRAAVVTLRNNYDGFAIIHLDYKKAGITKYLPSFDTSFPNEIWIGNYEGFRRNQNEQSLLSGTSNPAKKTMDAIILMLNDDHLPQRPRFKANEVYLNYLEEKGREKILNSRFSGF